MERHDSRGDVPRIGNFVLYYLFVTGTIVRSFADSLYTRFFAPLPYLLLSAFLLLSLVQPPMTRRFPQLTQPWLGLQSAIIFFLLLSDPPHDFYAMLTMALALVVTFELPYGRMLPWFVVLCAVPALGLVLRFEAIAGLVYLPTYLAGLTFLWLYGRVYRQMRESKARSEELLARLQSANQRLRIYAEKAEEAATAQERSRVGRELHDAVTQTVFSMNLTLEAARRALQDDRETAATLVGRVQDQARDALRELRAIVDELRPRSPAELGLSRSLEIHAGALRRREQLLVALTIEGAECGSPALKEAIFRVAQEALNNVQRHSGSHEAAVRLRYGASSVALVVSDCGSGFDAAAVAGREGFGLTSMRERIGALGGEISVVSSPGTGTTVTAEVPLERERSDEEQAGRAEIDSRSDR